MNWLEANNQKEKKFQGLALNTKYKSVEFDTNSEIDHEMIDNFVKCYKLHFLKQNCSNNATPSNMKILHLRIMHRPTKWSLK